MTQQASTEPEIPQQAGKLLTQIAGYVGVRTIVIGLRLGLLEEIGKHEDGITTESLAQQLSLDSFYVGVWCRSAYSAEILDLGEQDRYRLAPHMDKLLLDVNFPGHIGGVPQVMVQPEFFERFEEKLPSGDRLWWDQCSPDFIKAVSGTGRPFYNRMIPGGLAKVPGLQKRLEDGASVMELACGAGNGLAAMAKTYPNCSFEGVDGDAYSLINISMHECRDIDKVTSNVLKALKPDGYFVISDFPFPASAEASRTVPARVMSGIQFFEALIGDQLMPTQAFVDLLNRHGFRDVEAFEVTPVHAVTYGRK
jgi:SAM-dependent methyltransferase